MHHLLDRKDIYAPLFLLRDIFAPFPLIHKSLSKLDIPSVPKMNGIEKHMESPKSV